MKSTLMIGERYRCRLERPLADFCAEVVWIQDNPNLDPRLAGHVDLSAIRIGKKIIASSHIAQNPLLVNKLTNKGYEVCNTSKAQGKIYPDDAGLCACVVGSRQLIHNLHYTDPDILDSFHGELIHVNQGYANCSCCVVSDGSLITSDSGIERVISNRNMEILKVNTGGILLDGFEYGFIGGASITLDDIVLFTGKLANERDARCVESFVLSHGKIPVYLSNKVAVDIGSAVVL